MPLLSWGANSCGQLGRGTATEAEPVPGPALLELDPGEEVAAVEGGGSHTLLLTSTGRLLGCGSGGAGQLGGGTPGDRLLLAPVAVPVSRVAAVAAGWDFSLLLEPGGGVWACGSNAWGQLGLAGA
jgi:secretion-regulating guanine nucleotide exchange factor